MDGIFLGAIVRAVFMAVLAGGVVIGLEATTVTGSPHFRPLPTPRSARSFQLRHPQLRLPRLELAIDDLSLGRNVREIVMGRQRPEFGNQLFDCTID